eukprot:jgi/Mesvir1/5072/Mv22777-RA.1
MQETRNGRVGTLFRAPEADDGNGSRTGATATKRRRGPPAPPRRRGRVHAVPGEHQGVRHGAPASQSARPPFPATTTPSRGVPSPDDDDAPRGRDLSGDDSVVYAKLSEDPVTDGEMRKLAAARALTMGPRHAMQSYVSPPVVDPLGLTNCVTFFMPRKAGNGRRRRR